VSQKFGLAAKPTFRYSAFPENRAAGVARMKRLGLMLTLGLALFGRLHADDAISFLPPPLVEEPPPADFYFSLDLNLVQPRLKGTHTDDGTFSPRLDWTVSPRFELGFANRGPWNPYIGYRALYSDHGDQVFEPLSSTTVSFGRSTELHTIDLGAKTEVFPLFSVLQAQWDLSARISVLDFHDVFDIDFAGNGFISGHAREQFVGAGPRGGLKLALPFRDTGWSLAGQMDGGVEWGGYRMNWQSVTSDGQNLEPDGGHASKGGILWHAGGQVGLQYAWPVCNPRIVYSMGYMYEAFFSKELGFLNGDDRGRFDYHGPFVRFEWRF
jgi:hypothetical protein